jgi:hypothetical protein
MLQLDGLFLRQIAVSENVPSTPAEH